MTGGPPPNRSATNHSVQTAQSSGRSGTIDSNDIDAGLDLAIDEALLMINRPLLRTWQLHQPTVVLGRSSRIAAEVNQPFCEANAIKILRRCSGGATIVGGPGCLMYSVVVPIAEHPQMAKIDVAHDYVMSRIAAAARRQDPRVKIQGICDLTVGSQKCGGNALRVTKDAVLYHGTILHQFPLDLIERCLRIAPRQPEYRSGRDHKTFVTNLNIDVRQLRRDIAGEFDELECLDPVELKTPDTGFDLDSRQKLLRKFGRSFTALVENLCRTRYHNSQWHHRH